MDEPKKVAIVEDDAKTREMLRGFFSDYTAENGVSFDVSLPTWRSSLSRDTR